MHSFVYELVFLIFNPLSLSLHSLNRVLSKKMSNWITVIFYVFDH